MFFKSCLYLLQLLPLTLSYGIGHGQPQHKSYQVCNVLSACLPCILQSQPYMDCSKCPSSPYVTDSIDIMIYQTGDVNMETCMLLDQDSCIVYFAFQPKTQQLWMERDRLCPTLSRYDDNNSAFTDMLQYSPFFDVDLMCAAHTLAMVATSIA